MYGFEWILIIVGIPLLILNIVMIVKFFQIANDMRSMKNLFVDGIKTVNDERLENPVKRFYKMPSEEITAAEYMADKNNFIRSFLKPHKN